MGELSLGWPKAGQGHLSEVTLQWENSSWYGQKLATTTCQRWPPNRGDTTMRELSLGWPKAGCGRLSGVAT